MSFVGRKWEQLRQVQAQSLVHRLGAWADQVAVDDGAIGVDGDDGAWVVNHVSDVDGSGYNGHGGCDCDGRAERR